MRVFIAEEEVAGEGEDIFYVAEEALKECKAKVAAGTEVVKEPHESLRRDQ